MNAFLTDEQIAKAMTPAGKKALLNITEPLYAGETSLRPLPANKGIGVRMGLRRKAGQRAKSAKIMGRVHL